MELIKISTDGVTESYLVNSTDSKRYKELIAQGFKQLIPIPKPSVEELGEFDMLTSDFVEEETGYMVRWIVVTDKTKVEAEIERLKVLLDNTDYRVIKAYEYSMAGLELPYDIVELHAERQQLRDRIDELKSL